jgi:acetyl-CoA synthetase
MGIQASGQGEPYVCSVAYSAIKLHLQTAIIYEADEPGESRSISYGELYREVNRLANVLTSFGVRKGDVVSIYLPMTWHAAVAFFACARIGAIHSVVFAGFSAEALRERIKDCGSRVVITADEGKRGGRTIATKAIVDAALEGIDGVVEKVLVVERTGAKVHWKEGRDVWWHDVADKVSSYCPPVVMFAEEPLFILYVRIDCPLFLRVLMIECRH